MVPTAEAVAVMPKFAAATTVMLRVKELLPVFPSRVSDVSSAELGHTAADGNRTFKVTVRVPGYGIDAQVQAYGATIVQAPPLLALMLSKVEPGGMVSVSLTLVAASVPLLLIVIVIVATPPAGTGSGVTTCWASTKSLAAHAPLAAQSSGKTINAA